MHNEGLCNMDYSQNTMKVIKQWHTDKPQSMQAGAEKCIQGRKHELKRPLWGHKDRWEGNIKTNIQETGCEGMD
jgi:hypothetical protein